MGFEFARFGDGFLGDGVEEFLCRVTGFRERPHRIGQTLGAEIVHLAHALFGHGVEEQVLFRRTVTTTRTRGRQGPRRVRQSLGIEFVQLGQRDGRALAVKCGRTPFGFAERPHDVGQSTRVEIVETLEHQAFRLRPNSVVGHVKVASNGYLGEFVTRSGPGRRIQIGPSVVEEVDEESSETVLESLTVSFPVSFPRIRRHEFADLVPTKVYFPGRHLVAMLVVDS